MTLYFYHHFINYPFCALCTATISEMSTGRPERRFQIPLTTALGRKFWEDYRVALDSFKELCSLYGGKNHAMTM